MKVAVVHDWLSASGGAEKVTRELVSMFDADAFAVVDFLNVEDRAFILGGKHARTTFIQQLPFARSYFRWYLPLFPRAIAGLDLRAYDLILSSSYAVAKGVTKRPGQRHICYIHTPMRYAWVNEDGYLRDHRMTGLRARLVRWQLGRLRAWDLRSNNGVDRFVANSRNVAERVARLYHREADVLPPPVDPGMFTLHEGPRSGFLSASRLVPYKRIDRVIEAFAMMPNEHLTIAGDGPERERLQAMAPANVTFTGHLPQRALVEHMQRASALICAADEDMGLVPMEAQSCGTPVIALDRGGYIETVMDGVNGVLFPPDGPSAIMDAVLRFKHADRLARPSELHARASAWSTTHFRERMLRIVNDTMAHAH